MFMYTEVLLNKPRGLGEHLDTHWELFTLIVTDIKATCYNTTFSSYSVRIHHKVMFLHVWAAQTFICG